MTNATSPPSAIPSISRPCFIFVDREHSGSISMRKLIIESAKFNVLTARDGAEAIETFERFPAVNGVILNAAVRDIPCSEVIAFLRSRAPRLPIIVVQGPAVPECPGGDYYIDSFDPVQLLEILRDLFPRAPSPSKQQDNALKAEENQG